MTDESMVSFTANDRCDRCGAQAYTLAEKDKLELMFCLHHRKENYKKLLDEGWQLIDDFEAISRLSPNYPVPV